MNKTEHRTLAEVAVVIAIAMSACCGRRPSTTAIDDASRAPPSGALTQIFPPTGSIVSSHQPLLRWRRPANTPKVRVDICGDPKCTRIIQSVETDAGEVRLPQPLPAGGLAYWKLVALRSDGAAEESTATWSFRVSARNTDIGTAWIRSLDWNGDGLTDLALSRADGIGIHFGSAAGLSDTPDVLVPSPRSANGFGRTIVPVGDLNQDGAGDLAVGAPSAVAIERSASATTGAVFLITGGSDPGFLDDVRSDNTVAFGSALAAGDFNGDSFADLLIGSMARKERGVQVWPAHVTVSLGGPAPVYIDGTPSSLLAAGERPLGFTFAITAGGDLNGDGYQDAVVDDGNEIRLFLGSANGLQAFPVWSKTVGKHVDLDVTIVPDLDGDGFDDLLVHGPWLDGVDLFRGGEHGPESAPTVSLRRLSDQPGELGALVAVGDLDGDGTADLVVRGYGAQQAIVYDGETLFGNAAVTRMFSVQKTEIITQLHVGDFNGDGIDDLVIIAPDIHVDRDTPRIQQHLGTNGFFREFGQ